MTIPRHNREAFFKYYTPESAKLTLENGTRRWSTPCLFNDPFDNQFDLDFPEPTGELVTQGTDQFLTALRSPEPFKPYQFGAKTPMMEFLRQVHQNHPDIQYSAENFAYLEGGTLQGMQNLKKIASQSSAEIRRIMSDTTIFCISETHDNILMWSHYAANHTGAVIKFRAASEVDSPLLLAQPVRYSQEMPRLSYDTMMDSELGRDEILKTVTLSKSEVWAYEKEWRVWVTLRDKTQTYEIIPFAPEEVGAVYLGCKMPDADKARIADITRRKCPKAGIFAAEKHPSRFELIFKELP
jgi:hypothetical protein